MKLVLARLVTTWPSNITFHLQPIWLQTLVAIDSESHLKFFPSFCALPSEVAVLFNSDLSVVQDSILKMLFVPMSYFYSDASDF